DASASMAYRGAGTLSKFDYAATMVVALAMLFKRQQEPVGMGSFDETAGPVPPQKAKQSQINVTPILHEHRTQAGTTELGGLLRSLSDQFRRRNMLVIVSDFLTDLDALYDGLNRLRFLGHEVLLLQVLDRDEVELPFDGPTIFRDIEGDEEL